MKLFDRVIRLFNGNRRVPEMPYITQSGMRSNVPIPSTPQRGAFGEFDGHCPTCKGTRWLEGPHGGMSVNIRCEACGQWLNYSPRLGLAEILDKKD